jgi:hypothetical protein
MTTEIQFTAGEFVPLRMAVKVHLGKLALDLKEGDVVQFDGNILKIGGVDHAIPEFRGGVKAGWALPVGDDTQYRPKAADMKVRPAQGDNKDKLLPVTLAQEETYVGPARKAKPEEKAVPKGFSREIQNQDSIERNVGPSTTPKEAAPAPRPIVVKKAAVDEQDQGAKTVGKIRTPAVRKTVVSDGAQAAREIQRLDNDGPPARAVLASKDGQEVYAAEADKVESVLEALDPASQAKFVASQRKAQADASNAKNVSEALKAQAPPPVVKTAAKKPSKPQSIEEAILQGDDVDIGAGVMWDMKIHWRSRAKIAAEKYGSNPEALAAIRAVEVPSVVSLIQERLASIGKSA